MTAIPIRIVDPLVVTGAIPIQVAPAGLTGAVNVTVADTTITGSVAAYYSTNPSAMPVNVIGSAPDDALLAPYLAAMTVQPDATRRAALNTLMTSIRSGGLIGVGDLLVLPASHNAQAGLINLLNPAQLLSVNGTMTFTTDRGYMGDGTTGYLSTNLLDTAWSHFSLNSMTFAAWINSTGGNASLNAIGQATGTVIRLLPFSGTLLQARVGSGSGVSGAVTDGLGLSSAVRSDASTVTIYRNAAQVATSAANASTALAGDPILLNRNGAAYYPGRIAAFFLGSALDATKISALNSALSTYLTSIGGN